MKTLSSGLIFILINYLLLVASSKLGDVCSRSHDSEEETLDGTGAGERLDDKDLEITRLKHELQKSRSHSKRLRNKLLRCQYVKHHKERAQQLVIEHMREVISDLIKHNPNRQLTRDDARSDDYEASSDSAGALKTIRCTFADFPTFPGFLFVEVMDAEEARWNEMHLKFKSIFGLCHPCLISTFRISEYVEGFGLKLWMENHENFSLRAYCGYAKSWLASDGYTQVVKIVAARMLLAVSYLASKKVSHGQINLDSIYVLPNHQAKLLMKPETIGNNPHQSSDMRQLRDVLYALASDFGVLLGNNSNSSSGLKTTNTSPLSHSSVDDDGFDELLSAISSSKSRSAFHILKSSPFFKGVCLEQVMCSMLPRIDHLATLVIN